ncbi:MAG TPA: glycoside hydrolase family 13 protein [Candidatus Sulfotelmatobacter sp.]|nr:glycoside hydrolase family 13 protein [Candidatus Sulfotelmatobacter sp.]
MSIETPAWVRDAVFYQVFPDRFARSGRVPAPGPLEAWDAPPTHDGLKGGDLPGLTDRLGDLADLGVTALYLNPIFTSASNHRYHADDYLAVDPLLGGEAAWRELVEAVHGRGMRVILDGVFNHTGRGFLPFHHILETRAASPYLDWYHVDRARLEAGGELDAYPAPGSDPADGGDLSQLGYEAWWGLPALPKLNHGNPLVREYLMGVAEHWLRAGADGWRLDVPEEIHEPGFWQEFRQRVRAVRPDAYILAEIWQPRPERLGGDEFDATMDYPLTEALLGFCGGSHLDLAVAATQGEYAAHVRPLDGPGFAAELERLVGMYDPAVIAVEFNLLGSHDTPRFVTVCGGDRDSLRLATLIQMTLAGAPSIYYGDEIGLEGGADPANRAAFPPDRTAWDLDLRRFIAGAIALRQSSATLRDRGTFRMVGAAGGGMAYARHDPGAGELWIVAVNAGDEAVTLEVTLPELGARSLEVVRWASWPASWQGAVDAPGGGEAHLTLGPRSGLVARAS